MKNKRFQFIYTKVRSGLSAHEADEAQALAARCCAHDGLSLSWPAEGEADYYALLKGVDTEASDSSMQLIAALAVISYDEDTAECVAFTDPAARGCGYFTHLLHLALKEYGESDLLFPVSGDCADTLATLEAMEAAFDHAEHTMEWEAGASCADGKPLFDGPLSSGEDFVLDMPAYHGHCLLTAVSDRCVCLHHVEVEEAYRGAGCGTGMLKDLLAGLTASGIRKVILQVSGDNAPALALYKKTGFRITETLSYYLY